jgi:hypothetical protein
MKVTPRCNIHIINEVIDKEFSTASSDSTDETEY